jgi:hypothetical protein
MIICGGVPIKVIPDIITGLLIAPGLFVTAGFKAV